MTNLISKIQVSEYYDAVKLWKDHKRLMKLVKIDDRVRTRLYICRTKQEESMQFTEAAISNKLQYSASRIINDTDLNAEVSLLHTN